MQLIYAHVHSQQSDVGGITCFAAHRQCVAFPDISKTAASAGAHCG